ncbi:hypothetical protein TeGR_g9268 [Tetraparma gracilis]|uniref:Tr-type G domain-containing protein n=1 Tax=Tetraparma gracilis TaxID=2962635 RepID=A0ABQ6MWK1_9STRA|nr:hypothetical protein TeGR_g9268 [Tetraparma gracilis]
MSRHRSVRNRQYSYDYDDDYYDEEEDLASSYDENAHRLQLQREREELERRRGEEQRRREEGEARGRAEEELVASVTSMGFARAAVERALADTHARLSKPGSFGDAGDPAFQERLLERLTDGAGGEADGAGGAAGGASRGASGLSVLVASGPAGPAALPFSSSPPRKGGWADPPRGGPAAAAGTPPKRSSVVDLFSPAAPPPAQARPAQALPAPPPSKRSSLPAKGSHVLFGASALDAADDAASSGLSRLSLIVLGHVDHGKSTLAGRLLYARKKVDERTLRKHEQSCAAIGKASFQFAWVMDTAEGERERGVTMEVGTAQVDTERHKLTLLDAPGHQDFVPQVIAGLSCADAAVLVVSAKTLTDSNQGEFERGFIRDGQTTEHVLLGKGLGINQIVVAVNKMDQAMEGERGFSRARFEEICRTMTPYLAKKGFNVAKKVQFIPVSGLTGENVETVSPGCPLSSWYSGPTLLQAIDALTPTPKDREKSMRAIVTDAYAERSGVAARVRVVRGELRIGETVAIMPMGDVATVGRIVVPSTGAIGTSSDAKRLVVLPGDAAELYLPNVDVARVARGFVLTHSREDLRISVRRRFTAKIIVLDNIGTPIIKGSELVMHMTAMECPVVLYKLVKTFKGKEVLAERPRILTSGSTAEVKVVTKRGLCVETFKEARALGRFVLRRGTQTVAMGVIDTLLADDGKAEAANAA